MQPEDFPRRILLCTLGRTPQLLTETFYALACARRPAFVPTEIRLITTSAGRDAALAALTGPASQLMRLCREYTLAPIHFDASCIDVIGAGSGGALDDIRTPADNTTAADDIFRIVRDLARDPDAALHVSLAGGRKTMGFYLGHALCLCGRLQDRLSHVLVSEPFESLPDFFFPPAAPVDVTLADGRRVSSADAVVALAEIPYVHMAAELQPSQLAAASSFGAAVETANAMLRPPLLEIDEARGTVRCGGRWLELEPQPFAVYAWLASRCRRFGVDGAISLQDLKQARSSALQDFRRWLAGYGQMHPYADLIAKFADPEHDTAQWFSERASTVNKVLKRTLGASGQERYGIQFTEASLRARRRTLNLAPQSIRFVGEPRH